MKNTIHFLVSLVVKQSFLGLVLVGIMVLASCSQTVLPPDSVSQENSLPGSVLETMDFATPDLDVAYGIAARGSDVYVTGTTRGNLDGDNKGLSDGFLRRYKGLKLWGVQFGGRREDQPYRVAVDSVGNVYVAGQTGSSIGFNLGGIYDAFLMKYNNKGELLWGDQFGSKGVDHLRDIAINSNNEVYVLSLDDESGSRSYVIRRYSAAGKLLRTRSLPNSLNVKALAIDSANNVIVLTNFRNNTNERDIKLYKYSRGLGLRSTRVVSLAGDESALNLVIDSNDDIYIATSRENLGFYLVKIHYPTNGQLFLQQIGDSLPIDSLYNLVTGLAIDSNDFVYVTGYTNGSLPGFTNAGKRDIYIIKYDSSGTEQWAIQFASGNYGSADDDYAYDIAVGNAVYVAGTTAGNLLTGSATSYGGVDAYVAKLNIATGEILGVDQ